MRVYFDTEFFEDGKTIDLISIGAVREDGAEFYAESKEFVWERVPRDHWIQHNVRPHLSGDTMWREDIRRELYVFAGQNPEFWAYFCSYDWIALCQLFGTMLDLPNTWPMYCNDLIVESVRTGVALPGIEQMGLTAHNALDDAMWTKAAHEHLESRVKNFRQKE